MYSKLGTATAIRLEAGFKLRHLRWWNIGLVFLATLINYIDRLTVSVLAPLSTIVLQALAGRTAKLASEISYLKLENSNRSFNE